MAPCVNTRGQLNWTPQILRLKNLADVYLEKQDCAEATKQFVRAEELAGESQNALVLTEAFRVSDCCGMLA
jgi:hypothetical protein